MVPIHAYSRFWEAFKHTLLLGFRAFFGAYFAFFCWRATRTAGGWRCGRLTPDHLLYNHAAHDHGVPAAVSAGASCSPFCCPSLFSAVRLMILSYSGYIVYQYTRYFVWYSGLIPYRVYKVVHPLISEPNLIIDSLIFPTKHVQFMQIIHTPPGKDVQITQIKIPVRYIPV